MKEQLSLEGLEQEVAERAATKHDYVMPGSVITMQNRELLEEVNRLVPPRGTNGGRRVENGLVVTGSHSHTVLAGFGQAAVEMDMVRPGTDLAIRGEQRLVLPGAGSWPMRDLAHTQLATYLGIPASYWNKLRTEQPSLLSTNVNVLAAARPPSEQRFVRVEQDSVRAVLSDRYRPLDNDALLAYILPDLKELAKYAGALEFRSMAVTETKFYLKATSPRIRGQVLGDVVEVGFVIENSEVGLGAITVYPVYYVIGCTNMAIMTVLGSRKRHTGGRLSGSNSYEGGEGDWTYMSDETRALSDKAYFMQVRDLLRATMSKDTAEQMFNQMNLAAGYAIPERNAVMAVKEVSSRFQLTEGETEAATHKFLQQDVLNMWGLSNALTWVAGQTDSYDRASELEKAGGTLISLDPSEWHTIATAREQ